MSQSIPDPEEIESALSLAAHLKILFRNPELLRRALTHRSFLNENNSAPEDNERLEFLGDAVLDFLVAAWLYRRFPGEPEGELTRLRSALVGTRQLAVFARIIGLGQVMRLGRGEEDGGGRDRDTLLCATFEALVAAYFLDSGLDAVQEFVIPLLEPAVEEILEQQDLDPKSTLQEWAQANGKGIPLYHQLQVSGPDHNRIYEFEVLIDGRPVATGQGSSKQAAGKSAASAALEAIGLSDRSGTARTQPEQQD